MKKLSEYKDEEALDLLADLMTPISEILADKAVISASKKNRMELIKTIIKGHKKAVFEVLAILDGVPVEDYHCDLLTLPIMLTEILNDTELQGFFGSHPSEDAKGSSSSATANTKARRK